MTGLVQARDWLTVCQLPPCAHELSPAELVWSHLKRSLAGLAQPSLAQLTALVKTRLGRMRYRRGGLDRGDGHAAGRPSRRSSRRSPPPRIS